MKTHVSSELLLARPDFKEYILSPEVQKVFVPTEWTRIKNIPPIELKVKSSMPDTIKPPRRHVNPIMFQNVMKELKRMCDIGMYEEDSDSPIASPLVNAPHRFSEFVVIIVSSTVILRTLHFIFLM